DRLAKRMRSYPVQQNADMLVCVTGHWMRDEDWLNLNAWWGDAKHDRVVVFSAAGLEHLPHAGPAADRILANVFVNMLSGALGSMEPHEAGPESCPLFFDADRNLELLLSRQKFDEKCRAALAKKIPKELP